MTMQLEKNSRFDTRELKARLIKKVGVESFNRYFHCLNRFVNQKLSKSEFDKSCFRILGRENLPLHNLMIKAILRNACSGKVAPPRTPGTKAGNGVRMCLPVVEDGYCQVPMSPRKSWSVIYDGKVRDGEFAACDYRKPLHTVQRLAEQSVEDGEAVEHTSRLKFLRNNLVAPYGIPYCSASPGGARKGLPVTNSGGMSGSETVSGRMEQIAAAEGLGVSLECANTLNNMVDVYLKRLIRSGLELVGSRSSSDKSRYPVQKQQIHGKPINGIRPSNHLLMQNSQIVSLRDFKIAMELNPQQLGENWPSMLEKVCMKGFEE